jgi:hypothetical protein
MSAFEIQALVTFLAPLVIQFAKKSDARALAWIDQSKPKVCVLTNFAIALVASAGITFAHVPGSLTISWPSLGTVVPGLLTFLISTIVQFVAQHLLYDSFWKHFVKSPPNEPVAGRLSQ